MKATTRVSRTLLGVAFVLTATNIGYRLARDRLDRPKPAWEFPIGNKFPPAQLRIASATSPSQRSVDVPTTCRLIVVFDTKCGHCHTAKVREAAIPDSVRLPVVWLSMTDDSASARFAEGLSPTSIMRVANRADFTGLTVRATPIAFLVSAKGIVTTIAPYEGTEAQHRAFRNFC